MSNKEKTLRQSRVMENMWTMLDSSTWCVDVLAPTFRLVLKVVNVLLIRKVISNSPSEANELLKLAIKTLDNRHAIKA